MFLTLMEWRVFYTNKELNSNGLGWVHTPNDQLHKKMKKGVKYGLQRFIFLLCVRKLWKER